MRECLETMEWVYSRMWVGMDVESSQRTISECNSEVAKYRMRMCEPYESLGGTHSEKREEWIICVHDFTLNVLQWPGSRK
jgi:hypothetical protein